MPKRRTVFSFLYSPDLKEKISREKTEAIITGLHIQFGDLRSLQLLKPEDGYNIYKADFTRQTQCLLLELNDSSAINGYRIIPYRASEFPPPKYQ